MMLAVPVRAWPAVLLPSLHLALDDCRTARCLALSIHYGKQAVQQYIITEEAARSCFLSTYTLPYWCRLQSTNAILQALAQWQDAWSVITTS